MPEARYPRLAGPADLPRLLSGDNVRWQWPPPGTEVVPFAFPERWALVYGSPTEGDSQTYWVTTLGNFAGYWSVEVEQLLRAARLALSSPVLNAFGALELYPVIYSYGDGAVMRWIRSTFRGDLGGGVEQFQWKLDWGIPGNDPVLGETEAGAFAQYLGEQWAAEFIALQTSNNTMQGYHGTGVRYLEVGVASWLQDSPKNADGSGGDAHQEYPTAWYAYETAARPTGTAVAAQLPYEVSCAVTLQTNKRGPRGRGRLYLPPFHISVMDAQKGTYTTPVVQTAGQCIGSLFDTVKASTYAYKPIVVSMREKILNEITEVNVGYVPDAQRRRRRSQSEARIVGWSA